MDDIRIVKNDGNLDIHAPYNRNFIKKIKQLGATWNMHEKIWKIAVEREKQARDALIRYFGTDGTKSDLLTVKIRVTEDIEGNIQDNFNVFGRSVVSATGRDSGGKVHTECMIEGEIGTAGSRNRWYVYILEGAVITMYNVPAIAIQNEIGWKESYGSYEVIEKTIDKQALLNEKDSLLMRIQEIENILV